MNKVLGTFDVLATAFGAMIGWGWVVSTGEWIQSAGAVGAAVAFLIGGIMIYFVGLAYAELTTAMPESGGAQIFTQKAFGTIGSFVCTWALILSYIGVVCFEACSFPTIILYIFPGFAKIYLYTIAGFDIYLTWLLLAIAITALITYINVKGIKAAASFQKILTVVIAAVGVILVVGSVFKGDSANLSTQAFVGSDAISVFGNIFTVAIVAPFFLFGFDVIPQAAEEINVPLKKLGELLVLSVALAVCFYGLIVLAVGCSLSSNEIAASSSGSGLVTADAMAKLFNSKVMAKVLIVGGLCGVVTSWNSFMIGGSRAIMAMARAHMIPCIFSKTHPEHKTPYYALIAIGVISCASLFFGREMLVWIANSASFACCVSYCMVSIAFVRIRKLAPSLKRPFKVKNYKAVGFLAITLSGVMCLLYLIPGTNSTFSVQEYLIIGGWAAVGFALAVASKLKYGNKFGEV